MSEFGDPWHELGDFIREQRSNARLSVRRLSDMAGISNPYLSQIERGLRRPSAEILQQIARALRISAETLYIRAGILEAREVAGNLTEAILAEPSLRDDQKQTLLRIYLSFRRENDSTGGADPSATRETAGRDDERRGDHPGEQSGPAPGRGDGDGLMTSATTGTGGG
jgi:transcriptional regulator with XRE-family HTH domain